MQHDKEVAMEMLTEFIIEHSSLIAPQQDKDDDDTTWREIDTYGDLSYEKQFQAQLDSLVPQRRLHAQITQYIENSAGFIEYEIKFTVC
jgi:hypothetical protein